MIPLLLVRVFDTTVCCDLQGEQSQAHIEDSPSSEEYEHEQEQEQELEITPRRANKRLRSLFQAKTLADRENNKQIGDDDKEGEQDQPSVSMDSKETLDFMKGNIAQSIPPHLRQKFAAETVTSIRRLEWVSDRQMIEEVSDTMRELLRKPQRAQAEPRPSVDKLNEQEEDAVEQQKLINKIVAKAQMFLRNGQQKEAIRELSKENLKDVTNPKTKSEVLELVSKLFPESTNERLPTIPDDAPRVLVSPDEIFKQWLKKAVQKIKASGIDGISTQALRALQMEEDAVRGVHCQDD